MFEPETVPSKRDSSPASDVIDPAGCIRRGRRHALVAKRGAPFRLGREELHRLIPHRGRFLLLDAVEHFDREQETMIGRRLIDASDPVFEDHFPGDPVYPGVLLLEAAGQLGLCLVRLLRRRSLTDVEPATAGSVRALRVEHGVFQAAVRPGDEVEIQARLLWDDGLIALCAGQVLLRGEIAAVAALEVWVDDEPATKSGGSNS